MTAAKAISIDAAKKDKLFYFVANVVVCRESDGRCLLLKRADSEKVHPGKYAVPGGKLEWADLPIDRPTRMNDDVIDFEDAVENLLVRETREEAGIEIDRKLAYVNSIAFIRPDGIPVMLMRFAAKYVSGEVKLEEGSFTDFAWVNGDEAERLDCIIGVPDEVRAAVAMLAKTHAVA